MAPSTHALKQNRISIKVWILRALALALSLTMLLYGLIVIDTGIVNFIGAGNPEVIAKRAELVEAAEAGRPLDSPMEIARHSSAGIALLGLITSPVFAYGRLGLGDQLLHYATMPTFNGISLSLHNLMAGSCMLFGALQFWPALRRNFPRLHRGIGGFYFVTVNLAMVGALGYMLRTPVAQIYDQLTFYVELWVLAIGVIVSLWMSMYSLKRGHIAQHQSWMAFNYALLLTAPLGRIGWFIFAAVAPDMRQLEANYAVSDPLIPLCLLCGYGLFTINRLVQANRTTLAETKMNAAFPVQRGAGRLLAMASVAASLAACLTTVQHFWVSPGLAALPHATELIPAGVVQLHDAVVGTSSVLRILFVVAMLAGLVSGAGLIWRAYLSRQPGEQLMDASTWLLVFSGGTVGMLYLAWGLQLGMPSFATLTGGAMHVFGGGATLGFASLLAMALRLKQAEWVKEWATFLMACLLSMPAFYWFLPAIASMDVDAQFVQAGHVYRLASNGPWMMFFILAFWASMYSQATQSRFAR